MKISLRKYIFLFNAMKKLFFLVSSVLAAVLPAAGYAQEAPQGANVGICAVTMAGDTLVSLHGDINLIPASNTKLITTGTALLKLGADYRFETELACSGKIRGGVLLGDLYIVGGGDPTTASKYCDTPADSLFGQWIRILRNNGIKAIRGNVIGDGRAFPKLIYPYWCYMDMGFYYGVAPGALNFYENFQEISFKPDSIEGGKVHISPIYPVTPWMRYMNRAVTTAEGTSSRIYHYWQEFYPADMFCGNIAANEDSYLEYCSNQFPELTVASSFLRYLCDAGIRVSGRAMDIDGENRLRTTPGEKGRTMAEDYSSLTVLGKTFSPQLEEIVKDCLHRSDNFYAESIFQALGRKMTGIADTDTYAAAELSVLRELGLNTDSIRILDGSGMTEDNFISPSWMVTYLRKMASLPIFPTFLSCIPHPGEGTLKRCLQNSAPEIKNRVRMKSGSMNGVACYSGYILPEDDDPDGTVAFSIMINASTKSIHQIVPFTDKLILDIISRHKRPL